MAILVVRYNQTTTQVWRALGVGEFAVAKWGAFQHRRIARWEVGRAISPSPNQGGRGGEIAGRVSGRAIEVAMVGAIS